MIRTSALRPSLAIVGSVSAFALLIERTGFLPSVITTVLVASLGAGTLSVPRALLLAVTLAVVMAIVFVGLLDQPFRLVASW